MSDANPNPQKQWGVPWALCLLAFVLAIAATCASLSHQVGGDYHGGVIRGGPEPFLYLRRNDDYSVKWTNLLVALVVHFSMALGYLKLRHLLFRLEVSWLKQAIACLCLLGAIWLLGVGLIRAVIDWFWPNFIGVPTWTFYYIGYYVYTLWMLSFWILLHCLSLGIPPVRRWLFPPPVWNKPKRLFASRD